ncbi:MAG TPA: UDP-N-acetylmuramate--L-alanine ligase [bacterium]|nr:UDP-N-acetylmuramate--L-alanine ligase [bacterium]
MRKNDIFERVKRVHIIGIGGIGVSGLAYILLKEGKIISGSDTNLTPITKALEKKGVKIFSPQREENITKDIELIIYSQAIFPDNPEYKKGKQLKIPMMSYPEGVGAIMKNKRGITISGTHGKTTTSALVVHLLKKNKLSPSFLVGGKIIGLGNSGVGKSDFLVVEGCEYKRSFLNYSPEIAVLTNIEKDHLDYYYDIREIKSAFWEFCNNVKKDGFIVYCNEDKNVVEVVKKVKREKISYGFENGDFTGRNIVIKKGRTEFDCYFKGKKISHLKLKIWGKHNVLNSLACIAVGNIIGLPFGDIKKAVETFDGVHRRCEIIGNEKGILIIDDYGHHPTEIKATLSTLKTVFPGRRLIVVFQPHQYSRTRFLLKDFARSFSNADKIVVPDIYFVRDSLKEKKLVNAEILVEKIRKNGKEALYLPTFEEIVEYLLEVLKVNDIVLTLGAGPVNLVGRELLEKLRGN